MTERNAARRIEDRQRQAEEQAVETELCTVQLREERARIEAVAEAADGYAWLTPRQRSARRVARMLLVAISRFRDSGGERQSAVVCCHWSAAVSGCGSLSRG
ncbi:hypothetical protein ACFXPY_45380 [Streptomyces sp. NPDC059153]|uniref:hypothetical protein n=1 Tax=Streptomyces sp. NPDC059153 TaxID=3346743 RepID=UPI003696847A